MKLWDLIRQKLLEHPEQTVCEGDASVTYEELCIFAEKRASESEASYYGILCRSELAAAMALLSCIAAGKPAIPLPVRYGQDYYLKILERAEPPAILTDFDGSLQAIPFFTDSRFDPLFSSTAVVLFTSGSTGIPKGVMLSEENLLANVEGISSYFPIGGADTILISRPLYHSSVLTGEFLTALCNGAKIVFSSEPFQPLHILSLIKKHNVTVYGSTPTLAATLARLMKTRPMSSVQFLSISGECMTEGMAKEIRKAFPNAKVFCGYGLSEASPRVAFLPAHMFDHAPTAAGIALPHVNLQIVDEHDIPVPQGHIGELTVQGENVMLGYFKDAKKTKQTLRNGWLHTGDLAFLDEGGVLYIKGRKDDMIIRAGMNIYPAEIENALSTDARVRDVLAYGYAANGTQEVGINICGDFSDTEEVALLCRKKLPAFQMPRKIELMNSNDVQLGGKKKRRLL